MPEHRRMGIRYYAYAFDADLTDQALADPRSMISDDPLADAWGMPHGATMAVTNFEQSVPKTEMLYLDKAWSNLQWLTAPQAVQEAPRPAFRMFEGRVDWHERGWDPWVRAIAPADVPAIARDVATLRDELRCEALAVHDAERDGSYVVDFLERAVRFTAQIARDGRGFAYLIG